MVKDIFNEYAGFSYHSISIAIGIVFMFILFFHLSKKAKIPETESLLATQFIVFSLIVGGVFAVLADATFKIPDNDGFVLAGGTFYGSLIGAILAFTTFYYIFKKKFKTSLITYLNILAPGITIAHFCGRIGCLLSGCCYGKPVPKFLNWLGIKYPSFAEASLHYGYGTKVYPTPIFEMLALLIIFILLMKVVKKNQFYFYLITYSISRFIIEFFRGDNRGSLFKPFLSPAQFISLILFTFAIIMLLINKHKKQIDNK